MEQIALGTPEPAIDTYVLYGISKTYEPWSGPAGRYRIAAEFRANGSEGGKVVTVEYRGDKAKTLIETLNSGDHTTKSEKEKVCDYVVADAESPFYGETVEVV